MHPVSVRSSSRLEAACRRMGRRAAKFARDYWVAFMVLGGPMVVAMTIMHVFPGSDPACWFVTGGVYGWFFTYIYCTEIRGA